MHSHKTQRNATGKAEWKVAGQDQLIVEIAGECADLRSCQDVVRTCYIVDVMLPACKHSKDQTDP